jgi:WhiB family transcriptional regulator, redox-sensing transcriptional regulator
MAAVLNLTFSPAPAPTPDVDWMEQAACKGHTNLFFPPKAERPQARARREARARRLCMACTVLDTCRSFARENHEYGFWAGESEEDRHLAGYTVSAPIGIRARNHQG